MKHSHESFKDSYDMNESLSSLRTKLKILKNAYVKEKEERQSFEKSYMEQKSTVDRLQIELDDKVYFICRIYITKNCILMFKLYKKNY
jgi:hypothetical protein